MQLKCSHCLFVAKSLLLPKEEALAEIMTIFAKHLTNDHKGNHFKNWLQDCAAITSIAPTVVMLAKHSDLLDSTDINNFMNVKFSELVDKLEEFLGIEVFDNKPPVDAELSPMEVEQLEPSSSILCTYCNRVHSKLPPESLPTMS